jgi:hypothetical protein
VLDVYRPIIDNESNDFNYFRGNRTPRIKWRRWKSGNRYVRETMKKDTLSNGKIRRSFPSQISQVPVDENETYLRQNLIKVIISIIEMVISSQSQYYNFVLRQTKKMLKTCI